MVPAQCYLFAHRSDLSKRISENTLNDALRRMGYADQLTGHGMRATISTALNEIGYPKVWVDAQLSHADPDKVSAAYNHAEYVERRRTMMQDWANRLDLWGAGPAESGKFSADHSFRGCSFVTIVGKRECKRCSVQPWLPRDDGPRLQNVRQQRAGP